MRIQDLHKTKTNLITEGWNDPSMILMETRIIRPWIKELEDYIVEAKLSPEQINQLFTSVEQGATAAGGNRTIAGKAVDVAKLPVEAVKWIDSQINKLGGLIQQAGPVKNMDAKFDELKKKIGEKDSKIVQAVKAVSDWAKKNPGKASVAVGILTAAAAIAGGPLGGAIAGFLARATKDVLQGSKLSTAVGKSLKTAAYGALAGMAFNYISDAVTDNIANATDADIMAQWDALDAAAKQDALTGVKETYGGLVDALDGAETLKLSGNVNRFYFNYDVIMTPDQVAQMDKLESALRGMKTFSDEWYKTTAKFHDFMQGVQADPMQDSLKAAQAALKAASETNASMDAIQNAGLFDKMDNLEAFMAAAEEVNPKIAAAVQGAVTAAEKAEQNSQKASTPKKEPGEEEENPNIVKGNESKINKGKKLSEGQIYLLFKRVAETNSHLIENKMMFESVFDAITHYNKSILNEGPLDALKKGAKAVGGAIKGAAKQVTTKVTAEKLNTAWKKAGSPTDSDEIYDVIKSLGVNDDVIKGTYDSMQIKPPASTDAPDADADADAADTSTNANAPTDSTAGDAGSDTSPTGAADANAGGDEPAATDDATSDDELGIAKQNLAMKRGRGLSPEEEKQVEKDFTATKELKKQGIEKNTPVKFTSAKGQEINATIDGPSQDGKKDSVSVRDEKNRTYNVPLAKLQDQSGKPIKSGGTVAGTPDDDPVSNIKKTGNPVGAPSDGDTTPSGVIDSPDDATEPETNKRGFGRTPPEGTTQAGGSPEQNIQSTGNPVGAPAEVDIKTLAAQIKKAGPEVINGVKAMIAA